MEIEEDLELEENSWNFEDHRDENLNVNEENYKKNRNSYQKTSNRPIITISSQNQTLLPKSKNQVSMYESNESKMTSGLSSSRLKDQNNTYLSGRCSSKNINDVMRVQRPFSSQTKRVKKMTLFQPSPKPPVLTGPVTYYRDLEKIDKQIQREFDKSLKRKEIKRQMRSPYKENFVRLRADSVRSTRNRLKTNEKLSCRQRRYDSKAYREACEEEFESERRHCKNDYVSKTYPELRIIGV